VLSMPVLGILLVPIAFLIFLSIVAHYCNVIEDFGPHESDRVPVLLRNVSFSEDIVHPLYALGIAILAAFGPAIVLKLFGLGPSSGHAGVFWVSMAWGFFVLPAGVFTTVCSGALQNMLPQHALSVIVVAPVRYLLVVTMFGVACAAYVVALGGITITGVATLIGSGSVGFKAIAVAAGVTYLFCALAIYCMHLSTAWLGFIYRTHYAKLNWIYQRFERDHRTDTNARLAEMRKRGDPRIHAGVRKQQQQQNETKEDRLAFVRAADAQRRAESKSNLSQLDRPTDSQISL